MFNLYIDMENQSLNSLADYSLFITELLNRSSMQRSTIVVWSDSPYTGTAEGEVYFAYGVRLRMREELDFDAGLITAYGYEVYHQENRLYWYDDFPHPHHPDLASTFPHHKHIPPDIRHHRVPAPEMSFSKPNLPVVLQEIEEIIDAISRGFIRETQS
ncbi:MAG: hypothetical protein HQM12_03930 [SAR324 cluster bacterium]|nr:hypothetical protein [SAR324 cluster bacterium]